MYGFILATIELKLPFTFLKSIVVSTTQTYDREGWEHVDKLAVDKLCEDNYASMAIGLHYCKRYGLGDCFFSKYRLKRNIMNCEKSLLKVPPKDLFLHYNYSIAPPRADLSDINATGEISEVRDRRRKREGFMLCQMAMRVNEALRYHKQLVCDPGTANLAENYTVHDDPSSW